jgi:hypothetical protein
MSININTVRYDKFKPERLEFKEYEECATTGAGPKITYYRVKINYNYEVIRADGSIGSEIGPLYIRGPKESSKGPELKNTGFEKEKSTKTQDQWQVMTKYKLNNPEHFAYINRDTRDGKQAGTIHKLILRCAEEVFKIKKKVGLNDCEDVRDTFKKFHYPGTWKMEDGYPVAGENPAFYWKLFRYSSKSGNTVQTSFKLDNKEIPWDRLKDTQIEHIPVIKVENITIAGSKPTVKMELASSALISISDRGSIDLLAGIDDDLSAEDREKIRKEREKQEALEAAKPTSPVTSAGLIAAIPSIDGTPDVPKIPEELPVTNSLANLNVSLPADILPLPKSEPAVMSTPNAALNAMASSTAGTVPLPVLPTINLPFLG